MNNKKRKLNHESGSCSDDFQGRAWQQELRSIINDECDVDISWDISRLIFKYSRGHWEYCIKCGELTDPNHSKLMCKRVGDRAGIIYFCWMCDDKMSCGWKKSEYKFEDGDI